MQDSSKEKWNYYIIMISDLKMKIKNPHLAWDVVVTPYLRLI